MTERPTRQVRIRSDKDKDTAKPKGEYLIEVTCGNCDWEGEVAIPKGHAVAYGAPVERFARCADCGCYTLVRCERIEEEEAEEEEPRGWEDRTRDASDHFRTLLEEAERQRRDQYPTMPEPGPYTIPANPSSPYHTIDRYRLSAPPEITSGTNTWRTSTTTTNTTDGGPQTPDAIGTSVPPPEAQAHLCATPSSDYGYNKPT